MKKAKDRLYLMFVVWFALSAFHEVPGTIQHTIAMVLFVICGLVFYANGEMS